MGADSICIRDAAIIDRDFQIKLRTFPSRNFAVCYALPYDGAQFEH